MSHTCGAHRGRACLRTCGAGDGCDRPARRRGLAEVFAGCIKCILGLLSGRTALGRRRIGVGTASSRCIGVGATLLRRGVPAGYIG